MCPHPSRGLSVPSRSLAFGVALGLILPAAMAGGALAQAPGWVDPPAKTAPANPAPGEPASPKPETPKPETPAVRAEAPKPAPAGAGPPEPAAAETERDGGAIAGPRRRAARRLTDRPAVATAPRRPQEAPRPEAPRAEASDPRFPGWAGRAEALAGDYLAAFSAPNGALVSQAPRFYGQRLRFHGRVTTLSDLIAEKRRFAQRWPERRYEPRSTRTACNAALETCIVRTIVDFRAGSPARGARAQGIAELVLEVSFSGGRPVIVSESSRVLRRGAAAGALAGGSANG